jgi:hypothetical protein
MKCQLPSDHPLNLHPSLLTILYNTHSTTLSSNLVIYLLHCLFTTHFIKHILYNILLLVFIYLYGLYYSHRFIVSTFYWKAIVLHFTTMSWDIIAEVLDEQTLHSRRSRQGRSSSSSSSSPGINLILHLFSCFIPWCILCYYTSITLPSILSSSLLLDYPKFIS